MSDGLRDRALAGGTPLLEKLAALSDDEWTELTHRMTKGFKRALEARGMFLANGDAIGRAMHEASQVGGPWTPCPVPYNDWPACEHEPMGLHVADIIKGVG